MTVFAAASGSTSAFEVGLDVLQANITVDAGRLPVVCIGCLMPSCQCLLLFVLLVAHFMGARVTPACLADIAFVYCPNFLFAPVTRVSCNEEVVWPLKFVQTVNDCWRLLLQSLEELWEHVKLVACNELSCGWHHEKKLFLVVLLNSLLDVLLGCFYRLPVHALLRRLCEVIDLVDCKEIAKFVIVCRAIFSNLLLMSWRLFVSLSWSVVMKK